MNYACAAGIGAVTGLRSMAGPAIVSEAANRNMLLLNKTPLAWLGSDNAARASLLLAAGELIADKFPGIPNRTDTPALIARAVGGALCGYAVCGAGRSKRDPWVGAIIGGTAAIAAAWAGFAFRKHVKMPKVLAALLEDAVAVGTGEAVVAAVGR